MFCNFTVREVIDIKCAQTHLTLMCPRIHAHAHVHTQTLLQCQLYTYLAPCVGLEGLEVFDIHCTECAPTDSQLSPVLWCCFGAVTPELPHPQQQVISHSWLLVSSWTSQLHIIRHGINLNICLIYLMSLRCFT